MVTRKMRKSLITNRSQGTTNFSITKTQNFSPSCRTWRRSTVVECRANIFYGMLRRDKYIRENYLYLCKYVLSNKTFTHIQYESTILYNLPKMIQHAKFNWTKVGSKVILLI